MPEFVDTHCHIQSIGLARGDKGTRELWAKTGFTADGVINRAVDAGVTRLLCVGCDADDSRLAIDFAAERDHCWATIGVHPHEAKPAIDNDQLIDLASLADTEKVVAIGECGLDYFYEHSPKADQLKALQFQLELATETGLPLIFHVREAFDDFWPIFDEYKTLRGVLHSFTDSRENLNKAIERGLYIGVNGIATFTKGDSQLATYKSIPLDQLLLETDAPFLTPTPYRGSINEPKHVVTIAHFLAELRGEQLVNLARATTTNARQLFGI